MKDVYFIFCHLPHPNMELNKIIYCYYRAESNHKRMKLSFGLSTNYLRLYCSRIHLYKSDQEMPGCKVSQSIISTYVLSLLFEILRDIISSSYSVFIEPNITAHLWSIYNKILSWVISFWQISMTRNF